MKTTRCTECNIGNKVPEHYIGTTVSCPCCKASYTAIADTTGALTEEEKKRQKRSILIKRLLLIIGVSVLLIGGFRYKMNQAEDRRIAKERQIRTRYSLDRDTTSYRSSTSSRARSEWYSGGTLHGATMRQWRNASDSDRLATSADFAAAMLQDNGRKLRSMDDLKPIASALKRAISEAGRGGTSDSQQVSSVAAACWVLLNR